MNHNIVESIRSLSTWFANWKRVCKGSSRYFYNGTKSLILSCLIFVDNDFITLSPYVDDLFVVGKDKFKIDRLKKELSKSFDMKYLEPA